MPLMLRHGTRGPPVVLVTLVGLPSSGKSKLAHHIERNSGVPVHVVPADHYELEAREEKGTEEFDRDAWHEGRERMLKAAQASANSLRHSGGGIVVLDDTFHYRSMRRRPFMIARDNGFVYCQIHVVCTLEAALERNEARSRSNRVPPEVLKRTASAFEPPQPDDWWTLRAQYSEVGIVEKLICRLEDPRYVPEDPLERARRADESRREARMNPLHNVDVRTRRRLSEALDHIDRKTAKRIAAQELNAERRELLQRVRRGECIDPEAEFEDAIARIACSH